ncbi:MAG: SprT-like domain-containing protein [Candidatus Melainabacteria bacterium]
MTLGIFTTEPVVVAVEEVTLSEPALYLLFDKLNLTHFENQVPLSRIKWSERIGTGKNHHRFADFTVFQDKQFQPVIRLSKHLLGSETKCRIAEVLFHEMVHIWLWNLKKPWGHTPEFHDKVKAFNPPALDLD